MSQALAHYKSRAGEDLILYLDVELKSEKILDLKFKGQLVKLYESEIARFKEQVVNLSLKKALLLKRADFEIQQKA